MIQRCNAPHEDMIPAEWYVVDCFWKQGLDNTPYSISIPTGFLLPSRSLGSIVDRQHFRNAKMDFAFALIILLLGDYGVFQFGSFRQQSWFGMWDHTQGRVGAVVHQDRNECILCTSRKVRFFFNPRPPRPASCEAVSFIPGDEEADWCDYCTIPNRVTSLSLVAQAGSAGSRWTCMLLNSCTRYLRYVGILVRFLRLLDL